MKVFVTGASGQLGHDVVNELNKRGIEAIASDIQECYSGMDDGSYVCKAPWVRMDITDEKSVMVALASANVDAIIHCAAWTAVDAAEDADVIPKVYAINEKGPQNIAMACKALGIKMLHISTDYVFDGTGDKPWGVTPPTTEPNSVYGKSKLAGERAIAKVLDKFFIVRIAWVFGKNGKNFVRTMDWLGKNKSELKVVNDQFGTPTYTLDLARLLVDMIQTEKYGYYNVTNEGDYISWYDFACEIIRLAGGKAKVFSVTTAEYGLSKAPRPYNSRMDRSAIIANGFEPLPDWKDALRRYMENEI